MKNKFKLIPVALLMSSCISSYAATTTANVQVQATLNSACVVQVNNISFGPITPSASGEQATTSNVSVTCSKNVPYSMAISAGHADSNWLTSRLMKNSLNSDTLKYQLYYEENFIVAEWGFDGYVIDGLGTGSATTTPLTARMPLNQYVSAGNYSDSLTLTLSY